MITISERAAAKAKALLAKMGRPNLRIRVSPGGCSGLEYKIEPADAPTTNDLAFDQDGFQVLIDRQSVIYVAGSELVLEEHGPLSYAFRLKNPNAVASCSCGESFSVGDDHPPVPCCSNTR
ncbi:MAG: iron-sulfur cluster assembly accessory protein [Deltaproteobacteria bacterium]|nr:iron-sulfur cluster assembly accessory protein [Deltaproteobacteria bacterium]